jgi:nitroreductase
MEDNACALENIFLAAHSLGIGSVWINQLRHCCDEAEVRAILEEWGIPEDHVVYGIAALGYQDGEPLGEVEKKGVIKIV